MRFSIIVPVYKVEKYIKECVDSIISQTYTDFELLLIDDGSPDNCPIICDEYSKKHKNVKVIHKQNGGLSDARNIGIDNAKGEYLIFVDSDDYINSKLFLENISKTIDNDNPDIVIFGFKKYYESNNIIKEKKQYHPNKRKNTITNLIRTGYFKACAWDKIIRRKIIVDNNVYFPTGKVGEDIEWCAKILKIIDFDKIAVVNNNYYTYRQRQGSICRNLRGKDFEAILDMIDNEFIKDKSYFAFIVNSYLAYEYAVRVGRISSSEVKDIDENIRKRFFMRKELLNYNLSSKVKIIRLLSMIVGIEKTSKILGKYIDIKIGKQNEK